MELLIMDTNFEAVSVLDTFESLIWTDRLAKSGDFELFATTDPESIKYLKQDYYLWNDSSDHMMIVEDIRTKTDTENGSRLIVTGRSLEQMLDRRIVYGQISLSGNLQDAVLFLLTQCIINPTDSDRKISNFIFEASTDTKITSLTLEAQYTGDDLYTVITAICSAANIGFKITLNDQNQFVFKLYAGTDRSYNQEIVPYVIFSPNYENIINSNYAESKKAYKNVALIAGEGEGTDRKWSSVGSGTGINRREIFTDARDISSSVDEGTLTDAEYKVLLDQRGKETLAKNIATTAFDSEVEATRMFKYNQDFFIGDIIQIENEFGNQGRAYVSEFIMSQNKEGISMYPTFTTVQEGVA